MDEPRRLEQRLFCWIGRPDGQHGQTMFKRLFFAIFPRKPIEFPSDYPLDESVSRLAAAVEQTVYSSLFKQRAVGPVRKDYVRLKRVNPFLGNTSKPIFFGRFESVDGRVVLKGVFRVSTFVMIWMGIYFCFLGLWTLFATLMGLGTLLLAWMGRINGAAAISTAFILPLAGIGLIAFGLTILRIGWRFPDDVAYLSSVVTCALRRDDAAHDARA